MTEKRRKLLTAVDSLTLVQTCKEFYGKKREYDKI